MFPTILSVTRAWGFDERLVESCSRQPQLPSPPSPSGLIVVTCVEMKGENEFGRFIDVSTNPVDEKSKSPGVGIGHAEPR
jgi:hypothetical protein